MADDMLFRMMSKMVGMEPDQFKTIIQNFVNMGANAGSQLHRIEHNVLQMVETLNAERQTEGKPLIGYVDSNGRQYGTDGRPVS